MAEGNGRIGSAFGLAAIGTTCCALPATLVALGAGGSVASLMSAAPWLATLSQYKEVTFAVTAAALAYAWWQWHRVAACDIADASRRRWQGRILGGATALFGLSLLAAYALLPVVQWWESS